MLRGSEDSSCSVEFAEEPQFTVASRRMGAGLWLLHFSDIHFCRSSGSRYDLDLDLRNEVERDLRRLTDARAVDGILVTGDIAFSGIEEEYKKAEAWLDTIRSISGCPEGAIWVTPGNHDIHRRTVEESKLLQSLRKECRELDDEAAAKALDDWLQDKSAGAVLFQPLQAYNSFAQRYGCSLSPEKPYWSTGAGNDLPLNDGSMLRLWGLNSTLLSDKADNDRHKKLLLGRAALRLLSEDGIIYATLCHHPPDWLFDQSHVEQVLRARTQLQFYGHKHRLHLRQDGNSLIVTAGAVQPERDPTWKPRYNLLHIVVSGEGDCRQLQVDVYPRLYDQVDLNFGPDWQFCKGQDFRRHTMKLERWTKPSPEIIIPGTHARVLTSVSSMPSGRGPTETSSHKASEGRSTIPAPTPTAQSSGATVTPLRRLTYRFLSLSYEVRLVIAGRLNLIAEEDKGANEIELFRRVIARANETGQLAQLWDAVDLEYQPVDRVVNPFRS